VKTTLFWRVCTCLRGTVFSFFESVGSAPCQLSRDGSGGQVFIAKGSFPLRHGIGPDLLEKTMGKRLHSKYKIDRRLGENIWGRPKSPVNTREYGPGQHGQRRKAKLSDFGVQLRAKQKLKGYYGSIGEKQFRAIYKEAVRIKGNTAENLIGLLESRLDAVVYRAKFVPTVFAARQFVNHGHVLVNGKRVNIPSYRVKIGDVVEVRERSREMGLVLTAISLAERDTPEYYEVDHKKMTAVMTRVPNLADVPYPTVMEPNLVVEFYSS
jgi:small subunit ribosomal protein S4